jgi:hypothetical protein
MGTVDNNMFEEALQSLREETYKLEKRVASFEKLIDTFIVDYSNLKNKNKTK